MVLRAGVIGTGVHGNHHVRLLSSMDGVELAGIYDTNPETSRQKASEHNVCAFESLQELLENVDCVSVVAPTSAHNDVVMECLAMDKAVLVEKPISTTIAEADEMIAEAEKRGLVLAVGHIERYNSAYRAIVDHNVHPLFIESHRLAVFNPRGTDVAVVLDLMIHDIDIILDMVKQPVVKVNATGVSVVSDEVDIANARIEFENGTVANLTSSRISQKNMRKIRTFQKNSYVSMDFSIGESEIFTLDRGAMDAPLPGTIPQMMKGISYNKFPNDGLNALEIELADFINAVKTDTKPRVTGQDGRKALNVAVRVLESMEASARSVK